MSRWRCNSLQSNVGSLWHSPSRRLNMAPVRCRQCLRWPDFTGRQTACHGRLAHAYQHKAHTDRRSLRRRRVVRRKWHIHLLRRRPDRVVLDHLAKLVC